MKALRPCVLFSRPIPSALSALSRFHDDPLPADLPSTKIYIIFFNKCIIHTYTYFYLLRLATLKTEAPETTRPRTFFFFLSFFLKRCSCFFCDMRALKMTGQRLATLTATKFRLASFSFSATFLSARVSK